VPQQGGLLTRLSLLIVRELDADDTSPIDEETGTQETPVAPGNVLENFIHMGRAAKEVLNDLLWRRA